MKMYGWVRDRDEIEEDLIGSPPLLYLNPEGEKVWVDCISKSENVNPYFGGIQAHCVGEVSEFVVNTEPDDSYMWDYN
ncbi:MAG: hypothetical protein WC824_12135 [Bacteroidota bacterium]|jgi:hypothetical protein